MKQFFNSLAKSLSKKQGKSLVFVVKFKETTIGTLWFDSEMYHFKYDDKFGNSDLNLIPDFPEIGKEYSAKELFPFFKLRIPSLKRTEILEILKSRNLQNASELELLAEFGKSSTSDPYVVEKLAS